MNSISTFYLFWCLQWPTWSLTSNCSKILMHYPLLIQFCFPLGSVSNSCPTFLFIYLSVLFHFSIVHTYMKKHHRLMPQYSMRKCSMCIFFGLLLWWYPGTLFLGFSLFLDFLCTHLVYLCFAVNHSRQSHKIFPI